MKFSTCYALIEKRGFFLYQNLFSYDEPVSAYLGQWSGSGGSSRKFFTHWFETHTTQLDASLTFFDYGVARSARFGYFLVSRVVPHASIAVHYTWHVVRLFKVLSFRGKRHLQGLPTRGQRTHSNSAVSAGRVRLQTVLRAIKVGAAYGLATAAQGAKALARFRKERSAVKQKSAPKKALGGKSKKPLPAKSSAKKKVDVWR